MKDDFGVLGLSGGISLLHLLLSDIRVLTFMGSTIDPGDNYEVSACDKFNPEF
jgi:hypothetical protein